MSQSEVGKNDVRYARYGLKRLLRSGLRSPLVAQAARRYLKVLARKEAKK